MGYWKKHPRKDLELVLQVLHRHGYKILNPPTYYTVRCPCGNHQRQVHLTPSNPRYGNEVIKWARRHSCWHDEGGTRR